MDRSDKKEKRRAQNVKAAQRSYEAKKRVRENLQEKNTELVEAQMRLLHDKSRLQEQIRLFEYVLGKINHTLPTCPSSDNPTAECGIKAHKDVDVNQTGSVHINGSLRDDISKVLDLSHSGKSLQSISGNSSTPGSPRTECHYNDYKYRLLIDKTNSSSDEHIRDASFLGIGATLEVSLEEIPFARDGRCDRVDSLDQDDTAFVPSVKKNKGSKLASRSLRACGADALKKQRSSRFRNHMGDTYST